MQESEIERLLTKYAKEVGLLTFKFSSPSQRGVPDRIFITKKGKVFFIEFKSSKGKLTKLQQHTIRIIENHNINAHCVNSVELGVEIINSYA